MAPQSIYEDTLVARKASLQHGRVSARQLREAGVDKRRAQRWLAQGRLHRVHRGVYAVGHQARSIQADYMAAVLTCAGAVISHVAAAYLLRLLRNRRLPDRDHL